MKIIFKVLVDGCWKKAIEFSLDFVLIYFFSNETVWRVNMHQMCRIKSNFSIDLTDLLEKRSCCLSLKLIIALTIQWQVLLALMW